MTFYNLILSLEVWDVGSRVEDRNDYLFCMKDVAAVVFLIDASAPEKRLLTPIRINSPECEQLIFRLK